MKMVSKNKILIFRNWEELIRNVDGYVLENDQNYFRIKNGQKAKPLTLVLGLYATSSSYGFDGGIRLISMEYRAESPSLEALAQGVTKILPQIKQDYAGAEIVPVCYTNLDERDEDDNKVDDFVLSHVPFHRALTESEIRRFEELWFGDPSQK